MTDNGIAELLDRAKARISEKAEPMTVEEFDTKIVAVGDWYAAEIKRLGEEFSARLEAASVGAEGLPPHLVRASIARVVANLEAIANQST